MSARDQWHGCDETNVVISARTLSESYPYSELFRHILHKLQRIPLRC